MANKFITRLPTSVLAAGLGVILTQAAAPPSPQGLITAKAFLDIGGGVTVADLTGNPKFPDNPDLVDYPPYFEWPVADPPDLFTPPLADVYNNYGTQIIGYFYPPANGDYVFYLASDDGGALYLSTDDDPANKKLIAQETGWSPVRAFTTIGGGSTVEAKNSQTFTGTEWPTRDTINGGARITLQTGRAYYIEAVAKEGGGGDNLAVAVQDPQFLLDPTLPIPGEYLSTFDKTTGPVSITTQPESQMVDEGQPVTFSVVADGTPPFTYQWKRNGTDIPDATGMSYAIANAPFTDNGARFSVVVSGAQGSPVTSAEAVLTVTQDATAPTVVSASGGGDFVSVTVMFSERMDQATAETSGNYQISGNVSVSAATLVNDTTVVLTTSRQTGGQTYTLTLNNLRDRAATPNTIAAGTTVEFNSAVFVEGLVQFERWNTPGGIQAFIDAIADGSMGPSDVKWVANLFESGRGLADNYRGRGYTWFKPPQNGNYVFIMTVDDNARLFLSTDDNPANKKAIAAEANWSNNREWSSATEEQRSDSYLETEWPDFWTITLQANQTYYMEALWQEGGGGDGVEVTYIMEGDATPANGTVSALSGPRVGVYVDPTTLPPVVTSPTAMAAVTLNPGQSHTLSITATGATSYQWQWNGRDIPGATSASYTIPNAQVTHTGQYWCFAINANGSARSLPENVLVTTTGVFNIEAEDFDYDGGQTLDVASVMPYMGGAYDGLGAIHGVDYVSNNGTDSPVYRGGAVLEAGTAAPMASDMGGQFAATRMGEWTMTVNYKIGWIDSGDWGNYTRTFPTPARQYWVFSGQSVDGFGANAINSNLGLVTAGVGTANQTVQDLGQFRSAGTGAWSRNNLTALTDANGAIKTVELGGRQTIRWNYNSGDSDYLAFVPATPPTGGVEIQGISRNAQGQVVIQYSGVLQGAPVVTGPYTDVAGATSPFTTAPSAAAMYFRSRAP